MTEDHDILIEVRTIQTEMYKDLKELKDGTNYRLTTLERDKVEKEEFVKHEVRLLRLEQDKASQEEVMAQDRRLSRCERLGAIGMGLVIAGELVLRFLFKI